MTHEMNLQDKYFDFILNGTKRIELRLNDEKRQQIKIGDTIIFHNEQGETFSAEVKDLFGKTLSRSFSKISKSTFSPTNL